jgi:hypothetical protein
MKVSDHTLFKTGAIFYLILGAGHTIAHFILSFIDPDASAAIDNRLAEMSFSPRVSVLDIYEGLSLQMGVMVFFFGLLCLFIKKPSKKIFITTLLTSALSVFICFIYLPRLPQVLSSIALVAFASAFMLSIRKPIAQQ